ncbi:MAG: PaaI family thioesterase [Erysipelotrichaceae bacterium]|jgi:acyl-CoA thioesterase|nr:PaaI family thioesterase [Erysipelotrichaceae bacterium]MCR5095647.1 PaaI family thioesterase [Erysipelotrichaceae bacterium]
MTFSDVMDMKLVFEGAKLLSCKEGEVVYTIRVNESDVNPYGFAHGGYLFTLCDNMAGMIGYTLGYYSVTLQANINYLKSALLDDLLEVKGKAIHFGKTTDVVEVEINNQNKELLAKAQITLYNVKSAQE